MLVSDHDPAFAAEVDAYISDDSDAPAPPNSPPPNAVNPSVSPVSNAAPNDSIHLHRQRLNRFHEHAKSFLSNVDPTTQQPSSPQSDTQSTSDVISDDRDGHHVQLDTIRLSRFHQQAVSFLNRAYANEPSTLVTEEQLSPSHFAVAHSRLRNRELLQRFHHETMNILDAAASASASANSVSHTLQSPGRRSASYGSPHNLTRTSSDSALRADHTTLRIERDKARLEQHYQDVMSFLNRADNGGDLIEEQEIETAALDRLQLQRYAREATSFLDKAFRGDSSILVDDDDGEGDNNNLLDHAEVKSPPPFPHVDTVPLNVPDDDGLQPDADNTTPHANPVVETPKQQFLTPSSFQNVASETPVEHDKPKPDHVSNSEYGGDSTCAVGANITEKDLNCDKSGRLCTEEDRQIAEDRAALERFHVEVGDFLSKAYEDDCTVIVDDLESEASNTDRGLYARRVGASAMSQSSTYSNDISATRADDDSEAHTDDEFQYMTIPADAIIETESPVVKKPLYFGALNDESGLNDPNESATLRMERFKKDYEEAGDFLTSANVEEEDEVEPNILECLKHKQENDTVDIVSPSSALKSDFTTQTEEMSPKVSPGPKLSKNLPRSSETSMSRQSREGSQSNTSARNESSGPDPDDRPATTHPDEDVTMDLTLEDKSGQSRDWNAVRVEPSFYRQIPRGATVRFQRRPDDPKSVVRHEGPNQLMETRLVPESVLRRVERERDVLMATLEEIVNERSALAAQVSDLKAVFPSGKKNVAGFIGNTGGSGGEINIPQDIDLAGELREAHSIMAQMTVEMEETLSVLEGRCHEAVERANAAEERIIRMESQMYRLDAEVASRGKRISQTAAEERKARLMLERKDAEVEALRATTERDLHRMEEEYKARAEQKDEDIQRLSEELNELHKEAKKRSEGASKEDSLKELQSKVSSLTSKLEESTRLLERERTECKRFADEDTRLKNKLSETEARMSSENEVLRRDAQKANGEKGKLMQYVEDLERGRDLAKREASSARAQQLTAEAEAEQMRVRYEESLKHRLTKLDQKAELVELEESLLALKRGASERETLLQRQLGDFRRRAEQAEAAAHEAERGAKEALEMVKLVQERGKNAIEVERAARQAAESEREALTEELDRLKIERGGLTSSGSLESGLSGSVSGTGVNAGESGGLGKSGSKRGLRKSSSRNAKDGDRRRRGEGRGGSGDDGVALHVRKRNQRFFP